jgi:hypothetical protein
VLLQRLGAPCHGRIAHASAAGTAGGNDRKMARFVLVSAGEGEGQDLLPDALIRRRLPRGKNAKADRRSGHFLCELEGAIIERLRLSSLLVQKPTRVEAAERCRDDDRGARQASQQFVSSALLCLAGELRQVGERLESFNSRAGVRTTMPLAVPAADAEPRSPPRSPPVPAVGCSCNLLARSTSVSTTSWTGASRSSLACGRATSKKRSTSSLSGSSACPTIRIFAIKTSISLGANSIALSTSSRDFSSINYLSSHFKPSQIIKYSFSS